MYKVISSKDPYFSTFDVLHEPISVGNKLIQGSVHQLFNGVNTASFTIPINSTVYCKLEPIITYVKVIDTTNLEVVFDGRIAKISTQVGSDGNHYQTIECEDVLAFLHDSTQKYRKVQNTSIKDFLSDIINYHNSQVEPHKQFEVGDVTVTNSTDNVYRFTDDVTDTFTTLKDKLSDRLGGYFICKRSGNKLVLDYLTEYGENVNMPIKLGSNLKSAKRELDVTQLITRLVPTGADLDNGNDDSAKPKLTIESVNGGVRYLEDKNLTQRFGVIQKAINWNDVKDANILKAKGLNYLHNQRVGLLSWDVSVIDLSTIDQRYQGFKLGNSYPIVDKYLGITETLRVTEKTIDILRPHVLTISVGTKGESLTQYQNDYQRSLEALKNTPIPDYSKDLSDVNAKIKLLEQKINAYKPTTPTEYSKQIIDVSEWQGAIDWGSVKSDNVGLAIIRVQDGSSHQDLKYMENIQKCINAGIPYAVYAYFRGQNTADAQQEAQDFYDRTQRVVANKQQPIFYAIDVESVEMNGDANQMRAGVDAYMSKLNELGVPDSKIVLYIANHLYNQFNLNLGRAGAIWIPSYGLNDGTINNSTKPSHPFDLWQYTSKGHGKGINGNVDMNTQPSPKFIKQYLS